MTDELKQTCEQAGVQAFLREEYKWSSRRVCVNAAIEAVAPLIRRAALEEAKVALHDAGEKDWYYLGYERESIMAVLDALIDAEPSDA